jgi:DNA-binding CsgD family transcriptional regulator/tetratricopeptide (TPR) repeat protein
MVVELLEREGELAAFEDALAHASRGEGRVLLVSGEAGIGKTSLVRRLSERIGDRARVLLGACDDLLTPRTLGPLRDLQLGEGAPLRRALESGADRDAVFTAVVEELRDPLRPTVVIVEDAHWADEATRDVLAFLGRRVAAMPTVLVVTYRDELAADHPLRSVLGTLSGRWVQRLPLQPLSAEALTALAAGAAISPEQLQVLTGGNPFLVTEALAAPDPTAVPPTVRDAVAARTQRLGPAARDVLVLLAVAPGGLELDLLLTLVPTALEDVADTERLGLTEVTEGRVRFRHDLLRGAVGSTTATATLNHAHARILAELERGGPEPSRAAHHAVGARDVAAIVRYAPAAARQAMRVASHRDAIALLEETLRHEDHVETAQHVDLLRWYAFELYLANRHQDAVRAAQRAIAMLGDSGGVVHGKALTLLSHVACWAARPDVAIEAAEQAVDVLEDGAADEVTRAARSTAHANLAFVQAMQGAFERSAASATRALELSEGAEQAHVRPYALIQLGGAVALAGDPSGERWLREGIELAQEVGRHEYVPLGCSWHALSALRHGRPDEVERWTSFGIRYSREHQIEIGLTTLRMLLHELQLRRGDLQVAEEGLAELAEDPEATAWGQSVACTLLGRLRARRGHETAAFALLGRGWRLATRSGEPERIARAGAGWYEWAALYDDDEARRWGDEALVVCRQVGNPWLLGELLRLRAELVGPDGPAGADGVAGPADGPGSDQPEVAEPWAAGLRGAWQEAAAGWASLGWPYERARELAASGEVASMVEALAIYDQLGADRAAWLLRQRLREQGVQRVPRGPARDTRENPAGLTGRQLEVLTLLARGRTNAQIADELVLSIRTVDHHVSAVLSKLGVSSRIEASAAAARLGIVTAAG